MSLDSYRYTSNGKVYFVCEKCQSYETLGHCASLVVHQHEGLSFTLMPAKTKEEAVAMCKGRPKTKNTAKTHPTV